MQLIDWYNLGANACWVVALATLLAVVSFARWEARLKQVKMGRILNQARWQISLNLAGILFCLGLAFTSDRIWEKAVWFLFVISFGLQSWLAHRAARNDSHVGMNDE